MSWEFDPIHKYKQIYSVAQFAFWFTADFQLQIIAKSMTVQICTVQSLSFFPPPFFSVRADFDSMEGKTQLETLPSHSKEWTYSVGLCAASNKTSNLQIRQIKAACCYSASQLNDNKFRSEIICQAEFPETTLKAVNSQARWT